MGSIIVWFENDLRVSDNPALYYAAKNGKVVPLYIYTKDKERKSLGGAKKWWLYKALLSLSKQLERFGLKLIIRKADNSFLVLESLIKKVGAEAVYWNKRFDPNLERRDESVRMQLISLGVKVECFDDFLLHDPRNFLMDNGKPFAIFTPFWRKFEREVVVSKPLPVPESLLGVKVAVASERLDDLGLLPKVNWYTDMDKFWDVSEEGAQNRIDWFLCNAVESYEEDRDRPDVDGTSLMSPYLSVGLISPRQIWYKVVDGGELGTFTKGKKSFLRQLVWREFSYHVLYHNPDMVSKNLKRKFDMFPWRWDRTDDYFRWTKGLTGIPIIDAGMRQLWKIGWMHNRVRMIVASWLTKNLLIHWKLGEEWFWDTLVDADVANNVQGWQWVAGCGADAVPYFRIFNPVLQSKKFDPNGEYIKKWVPELEKLPVEYIHEPWNTPKHILKKVGLELGKDYPLPMASINETRQKALEAFRRLKDC